MDIQDVTFKDLEDLHLLFEKFSKATGYTTTLIDHTSGEALEKANATIQTNETRLKLALEGANPPPDPLPDS